MAVGQDRGIALIELEQALRAAEPGAVLVPPRILRRVIRRDRELPSVGVVVPHPKSYVIDARKAAEIVDADEMGLAPGAEVPPTLILLARPDPEWLASSTRDEALVAYWRLLFHARIHLALERRIADSALSPGTIRERIHQVGEVEFDEVRRVLRQEGYLLPPEDDRAIYVEFAAVYLELRHFADMLIPAYFPAIRDYEAVERVLGEDVDAGAELAATRLAGAPDPFAHALDHGDEPMAGPGRDEPAAGAGGRSEAAYLQLTRQADAASARGNVVRAAILRSRAARLAPQRLAGHARAATRGELDRLARRLAAALGLDPDQRAAWSRTLPALLVRSKPGIRSPEARLLYDLQKVCIEHEREVYTIDLVEWALSLGRRPVRRRLVHQREVLISTHLRRAARRLTTARLSDADRGRLASLLRAAVDRSEERLRDRLRPLIARTFAATGTTPANLPERIALRKLTEELLDRVVESGYLAIGDLRDALSRSNLKVPDVAGPSEFLRGDRLLRIDREFAEVLDGIYRRGEIYLRGLLRLSSLAFGTGVGRFLTRFVVLPYGGAFLLLEGLQHIVGPIVKWLSGAHLHLLTRTSWLAVGTLTLGLIHSRAIRDGAIQLVRWIYRAIRGLLIDLPNWFLRLPLIHRVLGSRVFSLIFRCVILPLGMTEVTWLLLSPSLRHRGGSIVGAAVYFVAMSALLSSRAWRDGQEALADLLIRGWHHLSLDIVPGLYRLVMETFDRLLEAIDRLLYTVDEWLRFRAGDSRASLVGKAVLGVIWFFVTYLIRIYVNLMIEPQINPIKHFPVVTVSHKVILPFSVTLTRIVSAPLMPLGAVTANAIAWATVLLLPGVFGFLVWELKENWRLYEANRPRTLGPIIIGSHGETMIRLLRPGLHSGTLPKHFARLRRAERRRRAKSERKQRDAIHHVEQAIRHFVQRDLVAILNESQGMGPARISSGEIGVGSNRIQVELRMAGRPGESLWLAFEEQSGWLLADVARLGWLPELSDAQRHTLATALAGFGKMAGVDLVREQIRASFAPDGLPYDIADEGLVVWLPGDADNAAVYDLRGGSSLPPRALVPPFPVDLPTLDAGRLIFARIDVLWSRWVDVWERDQADEHDQRAIVDTDRFLPAGTDPLVGRMPSRGPASQEFVP